MRVYSDAALAAMASGKAIVNGALAIYCDPPVFVWGGPKGVVLSLDGEDYLGVDDREIGQVTGGAVGGSAQNITLTLSGIDPDLLALLDADEVQQAPAKVYRLLYDGTGRTLLDARIYKRGRLDDISVLETIGGAATVGVTIESAARGLGRSGKRMRSDADQRLIDPIDGFLKHVSYAATKTIYFGGKKATVGATSTGLARAVEVAQSRL